MTTYTSILTRSPWNLIFNHHNTCIYILFFLFCFFLLYIHFNVEPQNLLRKPSSSLPHPQLTFIGSVLISQCWSKDIPRMYLLLQMLENLFLGLCPLCTGFPDTLPPARIRAPPRFSLSPLCWLPHIMTMLHYNYLIPLSLSLSLSSSPLPLLSPPTSSLPPPSFSSLGWLFTKGRNRCLVHPVLGQGLAHCWLLLKYAEERKSLGSLSLFTTLYKRL